MVDRGAAACSDQTRFHPISRMREYRITNGFRFESSHGIVVQKRVLWIQLPRLESISPDWRNVSESTIDRIIFLIDQPSAINCVAR